VRPRSVSSFVAGQFNGWRLTFECRLILERKAVAQVPWSWGIGINRFLTQAIFMPLLIILYKVGLMLCYNFALFCMSSLVPIVLQLSSATFLNLSLLTSNFFSLVVGLALFNLTVSDMICNSKYDHDYWRFELTS